MQHSVRQVPNGDRLIRYLAAHTGAVYSFWHEEDGRLRPSTAALKGKKTTGDDGPSYDVESFMVEDGIAPPHYRVSAYSQGSGVIALSVCLVRQNNIQIRHDPVQKPGMNNPYHAVLVGTSVEKVKSSAWRAMAKAAVVLVQPA